MKSIRLRPGSPVIDAEHDLLVTINRVISCPDCPCTTLGVDIDLDAVVIVSVDATDDDLRPTIDAGDGRQW